MGYLEELVNEAPIFDDKDVDVWKLRFETFLKSKDYYLWRIIKVGDFVPQVSLNTISSTFQHNEVLKQVDAISLLHGVLPSEERLKLLSCESAKECWDTLCSQDGRRSSRMRNTRRLGEDLDDDQEGDQEKGLDGNEDICLMGSWDQGDHSEDEVESSYRGEEPTFMECNKVHVFYPSNYDDLLDDYKAIKYVYDRSCDKLKLFEKELQRVNKLNQTLIEENNFLKGSLEYYTKGKMKIDSSHNSNNYTSCNQSPLSLIRNFENLGRMDQTSKSMEEVSQGLGNLRINQNQ